MPIVLGIDIGGTRVKAAIVNEVGETIRSAHAPTAIEAIGFALNLRGLLNQLQDGLPPITAAGIGCKGIIDVETSKVLTLPGTLHYLEGEFLSQVVGPVLPADCPVIADNDARVAMAGERQWGAARDSNDALMLTLGTGVGGAVISGGRILRGAHGIAGHVGHFTVDPDGPDCICGNRGCLETLFSAPAIESEAAAALRRGVHTELSNCAHTPPTCQEIFAVAANGDPIARRIVQRATKYLGGAIAALLFLLDSEKVILSGQITEAGEPLFQALREDVHQRTVPLLRRAVPIVKSELADPSGTLGAAALALTLKES